MRKVILFTAMFILSNVMCGQDYKKYSEFVGEAWKLYENKEYLKSAQKYSEAFTVLGNRGMFNDRYNAACSWALSNEIDSAFVQLFALTRKNNAGKAYTNYDHMSTDSDLNILHLDKRWNEVLTIIKTNKEEAEAKLDKPLMATLDSIYEDDQKYRRQLNQVEKEFGRNSKEWDELIDKMVQNDVIVLDKVKKIIEKRGWLGTSVIGRGTNTIWLVIQHADLETQIKCLPLLKENVSKGEASPADLAYLEDRVALRQGKKQIYGSQLDYDIETGKYFLSALEDPDNVNVRRQSVGLEPIESYIAIYGLTWDVEQYKKDLPTLEKKLRKE